MLHHHERLDGGGSPDGLTEAELCLSTRILAVWDAWDAMRIDDFQRPAIPRDEALAEFMANVGTQFDADVVATFEAFAREGLI
ncbi:MAG: hypothetical protein GY910_05220 [bacterium]|nr:hypothetical protein [bacterium]